MNPVHVLYGVVLVGSLTFGLEAFLIGFGGRLSTMFQRDRGKLLGTALLLGLGVTGASIGLVTLLDLELIYFPAFLIGFTLASGKLIGVWRDKFFKLKEVPTPKTSSEKEIRVMLEKRGFEELVKEEGEE